MLPAREHPPVYTVGARLQNHHWPAGDRLMQQTGIPVVRTERGGSITYHGPGQAVGYPILRLTDYCAGPSLCPPPGGRVDRNLGEWAIQGRRREGYPVWVGDDQPLKIGPSACGSRKASPCTDSCTECQSDLAPFSSIISPAASPGAVSRRWPPSGCCTRDGRRPTAHCRPLCRTVSSDLG